MHLAILINGSKKIPPLIPYLVSFQVNDFKNIDDEDRDNVID